jgi:transposase
MKSIAMNRWPALINAAGKDQPGVDVVFDRFPVSKHMVEALNEVHRMELVKRVARMLRKHLYGLLAYVRYRITDAAVEGLNGKIHTIKSAARGFPNIKNYQTRILLFCGQLSPRPKTAL